MNTHTDPISALAHTNAELVKAYERINKLEAELEAAQGTVFFLRGEADRYQSAFDDAMKLAGKHAVKLAETPWEWTPDRTNLGIARFAEEIDATDYGQEWGGTIRNAVTGEEVQP